MMHLATALNAAVVAHGYTMVRAICARVVKSRHRLLRLPHRHLLRRLLLTNAQADSQRKATTATMKVARPAQVKIAQSVAMAAIWSRTQAREHTAWRTRCLSQ